MKLPSTRGRVKGVTREGESERVLKSRQRGRNLREEIAWVPQI